MRSPAPAPASLQILKLALEDLQKNHNLSPSEALRLITSSSSASDDDLHLPLSIFVQDITVLEAIIKHLKEHHEKRFTDIAGLIKRSARSVWGSYQRAQKNHPLPLPIDPHALMVPLKTLIHATLTPTQLLILHLKDTEHMRLSDIARLIHRDPRTVWAMYATAKRAGRKGGAT